MDDHNLKRLQELIDSWRKLRDRLVPEDQMTARLAYDECIADLEQELARIVQEHLS